MVDKDMLPCRGWITSIPSVIDGALDIGPKPAIRPSRTSDQPCSMMGRVAISAPLAVVMPGGYVPTNALALMMSLLFMEGN